jgi:hypothetical protein
VRGPLAGGLGPSVLRRVLPPIPGLLPGHVFARTYYGFLEGFKDTIQDVTILTIAEPTPEELERWLVAELSR